MSKKTTIATFLERARKVHGKKYDYSKVIYKGVHHRVIIVCPIHGDFDLRARAHYDEHRGCPKCDKSGKSGFHKSDWYDKPKFLYLIEFFGNGERFLKFGVTINGVKGRVIKGQIPYTYETLFEKKLADGEKAILIEKKIKSKYLRIPYHPELSFRGDSECLEFGIKNHLLKDLDRILNE